jgi:ABC-type multidrug transport system fused ATPase/permease subunit
MKLFSDISFLWSTFGPFKKSAVILFFIIIASALTETLGLAMILPLLEIIMGAQSGSMAEAKYLAPVLDNFPKNLHLLVVCSIYLFLLIIKSLFAVLHSYYSTRFITNLRRYWSCGIMESYMRSNFASLLRQKQGVLMNNMINEPSFASKALRDMTDFIAKSIITIFIVAFLFIVSWRISLIICVVSGLLLLILWRITHSYSMGVGKKKIKLNQQISGVAAESIAGVRQVKTFSIEDRVIKEFSDRLDRLVNLIVRFTVISMLPKVFGELIIFTLIIGALLFYQYVIGLSVASIIPIMGLFMISAQKLFSSLTNLLSQRMSIISYMPSFKLVNELINDKAVLEDRSNGRAIKSFDGGIRFRNVSFSYTGERVLFDSLNLEISKGNIAAVAGPSGSGKSTICDLLIRFYKPMDGEIVVDNINLQEFDIKAWRSLIGYVSQDSFLFNTTVRENILIGKPDAAEKEIIWAAQLANAREFIEALPEKYDTILGDSGVTLSGGQRQRIAIARAIVRNPELLILDEATSALDLRSEQYIYDSLKEFSKTKAVLLISHRLSSLRFAGQIYVLENGVIVESGQYDKLIEGKGLFWELEQLSRKNVEQSYAAPHSL